MNPSLFFCIEAEKKAVVTSEIGFKADSLIDRIRNEGLTKAEK
jgi:hypothetical protein